MSRAFDSHCRVSLQKKIGPGLFHLVLEAPGIARLAKPGQFVQVKVTPGIDPLLRRPMSISRAYGGRIEMIYEAVGRGTRALSLRRKGEKLQVMGPLGKGFRVFRKDSFPVIVGGGIGVPPLLFLAQRIKGKGMAFLGARTKSLLLGERVLSEHGWALEVSTDDGTRGRRGVVSEIFSDHLAELSSLTVVYTCGPLPMLKAVAGLCAQRDLACQVSLEAMMACGMGVCRGCVVPVREEGNYMDICREGPVVDAKVLRWEEEPLRGSP